MDPRAATPVVSRRTFLLSSAALVTAMAARPLRAAEDRRGYADALRADPDLSGYWRFDGDLQDVLGKSNASGGASASFVKGTLAEGQAIQLVPHDPVAIADTDHLRGRSATLSLFFKMTAAPTGEQHPVLLAESAGQHARYVVGVKRDLSALLYRMENAKVVTEINLPTDQPIEVGRWYHLAITSFDLDVRAYIDGYECSLFGGAYEFTRRGPKEGGGDDSGRHAGRGLGIGRAVLG